ncbi:methionine--tRNA ligase [Bradyrhizobium sp. ARR65]|uniref:methionine--tRNA ligase n=1 Tax=Bradyrhizobium sp. ARR65 TaxID=1040989 RepID=UPI00046545C4|nr:methionine--tRNA ligase [Bradyrhizobium sp. ARR65]
MAARKTIAKKTTKKAAKRAGKKRARKSAAVATKKRAKAKRGVKKATGAAKKAKRGVKKAGKVAKTAAKTGSASKTAKRSVKKAPKAAAESTAARGTKAAKSAVAKPARATTPKAATVETPQATSRGNRFYITTAIAYPNGTPHIGHAYEAIATDALARFQRLDGKDVFFLTGTDEHGLKMIQTAQNEGMLPHELATRNAGRFKDMDERLNVSFDRFIRTTEEQHHRSSQEIWRRMAKSGDIYLDSYSGWYSVRDEAYYAEEETRLSEDGVRLGPQGTPVEWVEEESYFFRLSAYQDKLLALYESQPDFVGPDARKNEVISFVKSGLRDLSISRTTFDWGVKVPDDPKHVMYVWVDALTNYITGVGFPDEGDPNWRYWPADVHVIGKDIIRFHAVYWPAFLMSAGITVQKRVYAHGFLFNRGEKMSKSVGNVVDPFNLADQYGVDQIRYFFLREVPFGQDGNYNHEAIVARINADLANDLGNLAQRSLSMIAKQLGGVLPEPGAFSDSDKSILAEADAMIAASRSAMATQQIHQWLNTVWSVVAEANRYFAGEAPWALAKTDPVRQRTVLYVTAEVVRQIAILTQPVMPAAAAKLLDSLGIPESERNFAMLGGTTRIAPGTKLPAPQAVFPRYIEPTAA